MRILTESEARLLQDWIDKLSSFTSETKENAIIEWANQVPVRSFEDIDYAPLYLFGDVTLDKAITDLVGEKESSEKVAAEISKSIKTNFCMDCSVIDIPFSMNKQVGYVIPLDSFVKVDESENFSQIKDYLERNNFMNCDHEDREDGLYLRTKDSIPVQHKLLKASENFSIKYTKVMNRKNFARVEESDLLKNEELKQMGFEVLDYSECQWLLANDKDAYIITKYTPDETIEVEYMDGSIEYYTDLQDFVKILRGNKYFSTPKNSLASVLFERKLKKNFSIDGNSEAFKSGRSYAQENPGLLTDNLRSYGTDELKLVDQDLANFIFGYNSVDKKSDNFDAESADEQKMRGKDPEEVIDNGVDTMYFSNSKSLSEVLKSRRGK